MLISRSAPQPAMRKTPSGGTELWCVVSRGESERSFGSALRARERRDGGSFTY